MRQADMMKRVGAAAGVESTFVDAVLSSLTRRMGDALRMGYSVSLYPLGYWWPGRRKATFRKVVTKGGARLVKRIAPRAVPRFRSLRAWTGVHWDN